jgi:hypothetical protein
MHTDAADVGFGGKLDVAGNPGDRGQWQDQGIWEWKDRAECISVRELKVIRMVLMGTLGERVKKDGRIIFIESLRRQLECRACDKRIRGAQPVHDERTTSLEEGARRTWAPAFVRMDTIRCKQIRRRTVTSFFTWRPISETDAAAFRRGWDDGAPRLVPPPATRRTPHIPPPPVPL